MREIKFRIWDKIDKKIVYIKDTDSLYIKNNKIFNIFEYKEFGVIRIRNVDVSCRYELMQYTGFKDKNGKEIYEGDIVNKIGIVSEEVFELKKDYIEINTPQLGNVLIFTDILYDRKTGYKELLVKENTNGILSETQNYEVIGNIYKNPELLEGEE